MAIEIPFVGLSCAAAPAAETGEEAKLSRRSHRVCTDQIYTLIKNSPRLQLAALLTEILLAAAVYGSVPTRNIVIWVLLLGVGQATAVWLYFLYKRNPPQAHDIEKWYWMLRMRSALAGIAWGSAAFLLWCPENPVLQGLLAGALFGVVAGAVTALPVVPTVFYAFVTPVFLPLIARTALEGSLMHLCLAGFGLVMFVILVWSGYSFSKLTRSALAMRYENLDLIDELRDEKSVAEQSRREAELARDEAEQARRDAEYSRDDAQRANRAKSAFLAAASHDLRQPMHAIGLYVAALRRRVSSPEAGQVIGKLDASVGAMEEMFDALLDMSKLDAGVVASSINSFALQSAFERIELHFGAQARAKGIELRVRPTRLRVKSDAALLDRIVRNLAANAIRYTNKGKVLVGCRRRGDQVRIEVWDTGIGIPAEKRQEIFQEFVQLGNAERDRSKGLGIGLSIVRRVSKLLNHPIGLDSQVGKGSRFYVDVPLGSAAPAVQAKPAAVVDTAVLDGAFVVVIDDEPAVRDSTVTLLQEWGVHTLAAGSAREALEQLAKHARSPDAVISDYRLRDQESGIEAIKAVQDECGDSTCGILITGDVASERLQEASCCGYQWLHKPLNADRLLEAVSAAVRQSQQMGEAALAEAALP
jgi:two-component system, sensor histidine kinase